jgi:hypothetical protein
VQVRFELTFYALNPELKVVAPWREWDITGREDAIEYAKKHNVPVPVSKKSIYSRDRNLWHLSHEVSSYFLFLTSSFLKRLCDPDFATHLSVMCTQSIIYQNLTRCIIQYVHVNINVTHQSCSSLPCLRCEIK